LSSKKRVSLVTLEVKREIFKGKFDKEEDPELDLLEEDD